MKQHGLVPNFYIHVSVRDSPCTIGPQTQYNNIVGTIMGIY
jgi:hypothetical protein